jgi:hypothetical protein
VFHVRGHRVHEPPREPTRAPVGARADSPLTNRRLIRSAGMQEPRAEHSIRYVVTARRA